MDKISYYVSDESSSLDDEIYDSSLPIHAKSFSPEKEMNGQQVINNNDNTVSEPEDSDHAIDNVR